MKKALSIRDIPKKYKKLKMLGRGATSVVYDIGDDKVLMFTKEPLKFDWLKSIGMYIEHLGYIPSFYGFKSDIEVFEMEKLYQPTDEEKKRLSKLCDLYYDIYYRFLRKYGHEEANVKTFKFLKRLLKKHNINIGKFENNFIKFIYDFGEKVKIDCHSGNFMKTKTNDIIPIDIFMSDELFDYLIRKN